MGRKSKNKKLAEAAEDTVEVKDPAQVKDTDEETPAEHIARLEGECEELRAKWLRAQADYKNLRRRGQLDYEAGLQRALQPLFEELLLVHDFLDMALASPTTTDEARNLALGVEMTRTKLVQALEQAGVKSIPTDGLFDPALHDATEAREDPGAEPGTVVETVRRGYTWRDSVLRHARVVVAAGPEDAEPEETPRDTEADRSGATSDASMEEAED